MHRCSVSAMSTSEPLHSLCDRLGPRLAFMHSLGTIEQHDGFLARQHAGRAGLLNGHADQFQSGPCVVKV